VCGIGQPQVPGPRDPLGPASRVCVTCSEPERLLFCSILNCSYFWKDLYLQMGVELFPENSERAYRRLYNLKSQEISAAAGTGLAQDSRDSNLFRARPNFRV